MKTFVTFITIFICITIAGCMKAKMLGDDQLMKFQTKEMNNDVSAVKELQAQLETAMSAIINLKAEMKAQAQVAGQIGAGNRSEQTTTETKNDIVTGNGSIFNSPEMINTLMAVFERILIKFFLVLGLMLGLPMLGMILIMLMSMIFTSKNMKILFSQQDDLLKKIK